MGETTAPMVTTNGKRPTTALVLSGGGARGAYEAGFVRYLRTEVARSLGFQPRFDIICGTSVGAINACYIAATHDDPEAGARGLWDLWAQLDISQVFHLSARHLIKIPRWLLGAREERMSLLRTGPLEELVRRKCPWPRITQNIRRGHLRALTVSATHIKSGTVTVFSQEAGGDSLAWSHEGFMVSRRVRIGPWHALASAAIPLVFPAVRIAGDLFCDGGLRQNTPLLPAVAMGADRVLVVGLRYKEIPPVPKKVGAAPSGAEPVPTTQELEVPPRGGKTEAVYPSAAFLFGKVLNALLLDQVEHDLQRLRAMNVMLQEAGERFGQQFVDRIGELHSPFYTSRFRNIRELYIRPGRDLGVLAADHVDDAAEKAGPLAGRILRRLTSGREGTKRAEDLASYVMFHGPFAQELMAQAMNDCREQHDRLCAFFRE